MDDHLSVVMVFLMRLPAASMLTLMICTTTCALAFGQRSYNNKESQPRDDLNEHDKAAELGFLPSLRREAGTATVGETAASPLHSAEGSRQIVSENDSRCSGDYPLFGRLGELLEAWSPNDPDVPQGLEEKLQVKAE